jgi:predicted ATPase
LTLDFEPLTVLIGVNAAGKSNILEALQFLQWAVITGDLETIRDEIGIRQYVRVGATEPMEIEIDFSIPIVQGEPPHKLNYRFRFDAADPAKPVIEEKMCDLSVELPNQTILTSENGSGKISGLPFSNAGLLLKALSNQAITYYDTKRRLAYNDVAWYIATRWQFLAENFMPELEISRNLRFSRYVIAPDASTTLLLLDFMRREHQEIYEQWQTDMRYIFWHVADAKSVQEEGKVRLAVREKRLAADEAPTISTGTARVAAMLTAGHLLDTRTPDMPGVICIEEPDSAINPGLLYQIVGRLREFTQNPERPRQVILTTHHPTLVNYLQPEEIRVVTRDDENNTIITVPDAASIREIWLDDHGLGEAWAANAFDGWDL